jgi:hypothetical protein
LPVDHALLGKALQGGIDALATDVTLEEHPNLFSLETIGRDVQGLADTVGDVILGRGALQAAEKLSVQTEQSVPR